jgi:hypothetical protein
MDFDPRREATLTVLMWFEAKTSGPEMCSDAREVVFASRYESEAGDNLKRWFLDHLGVNYAVRAPFTDLGFNLISLVLEMVDWPSVVAHVRSTPEDNPESN